METLADLVEQLGGIPLDRIRIHPPAGTATEEDVIAAYETPRKLLCELVDGVLIQKGVGIRDSFVSWTLAGVMGDFREQKDLGAILGPTCPFRLSKGLRAESPMSRLSRGSELETTELPDDPIPDLVPDLVAEVLNESETHAEMARKLSEYFLAGVRLVWLIQPETQTAEVYTSPAANASWARNRCCGVAMSCRALACPFGSCLTASATTPKGQLKRDDQGNCDAQYGRFLALFLLSRLPRSQPAAPTLADQLCP